MKNKYVAAVLALTLGTLGVHKFYLERHGAGFLYLFFFWTGIPAILSLVDGVVLLLKDDRAFDLQYNARYLAGAAYNAPQLTYQQPYRNQPQSYGHAPGAGRGAYGAPASYGQGQAPYAGAGQQGWHPPQQQQAPPQGWGAPPQQHAPPQGWGAPPQQQGQNWGAPPQQQGWSAQPQGPSVTDELRRLQELRISGTITEEEFQAHKQRLLS